MGDAQGRVLWSGQRAALVAEQVRLSSIISHQWHPRSPNITASSLSLRPPPFSSEAHLTFLPSQGAGRYIQC